MGLFDKFKSAVSSAVGKTGGEQEMTFTFTALPESLAEMQAMPEASLDSPFKTAALTLCALCAYAADRNIGGEMLDWLRGPKGALTTAEKQFLNDRFTDGKHYVPFSYFNGAKPDNDYTPSEPFTVRVFTNSYSFQEENGAHYATLYLTSGGADSPRSIKLRKKESTGQWFLWEQYVMVGIRQPKSADPWA
ncbi:MAG: hypothetical protein J5940_03180 [Clostridia bacterium]|nr:hypothetical protein [Clostridia bacterium]